MDAVSCGRSGRRIDVNGWLLALLDNSGHIGILVMLRFDCASDTWAARWKWISASAASGSGSMLARKKKGEEAEKAKKKARREAAGKKKNKRSRAIF